jgi:crossover junction endodeoxyribonuclease RuvC
MSHDELVELWNDVKARGLIKKFHGLRGGDKEGSRQRALQLFPAAHALLARKKDHGRAEASLIALFGAKSHGSGR